MHWIIWNIPAGTRKIEENSASGVQGMTDSGKNKYHGPCPPSGVHRYFFKLYALDVESLDAEDKDDFYSQVEEHAIAKAELMGKYTKG